MEKYITERDTQLLYIYFTAISVIKKELLILVKSMSYYDFTPERIDTDSNEFNLFGRNSV